MSIETKMDYLVETKNEIKQAIRDQGTDVSDALPFRQYADKVRNIVTSVDGVDIHEIKRGENLLINSYWTRKANIINQDRDDYYTLTDLAACYTIDQWLLYRGLTGSQARLTVEEGGLKYQHMAKSDLSNTTWNTAFFTRKLVSELGLTPGDQVTFSMAYTVDAETYVPHDTNDYLCLYVEFYIDDVLASISTTQKVAPDNAQQMIESITFTIPENCANAVMTIGMAIVANTADTRLYGAKLEKGSVQTLAHKENGLIVIDEPAPNPALELLKCKRYYYRDTFIGYQSVCSGVAFSNDVGKIGFRGNIVVGVRMRTVPIVVALGECRIVSSASKWDSGVTCRYQLLSNNGIDIQFDTNIDAPTDVDVYTPATLMGLGNGLNITLDARL